MRLIAVGAALVAVVFTLIAVIVVLVRGNGREQASAQTISPLSDHAVRASDAVRLQRNEIELVIEKGVAQGLHVKDPTLAQSLGLQPDDVITSISGKPMTRELDAYDVILKLSLMSATTMYVEVSRKGKPTLLRWRLDGDLRQARYGATSSSLLGSTPYPPPSYTTPSYPPPSPAVDPLADTIEQVDDTHFKVPRATLDAVLANPMSIARGARVVPSMRNGQADGFKLYAIRPSSIYAKLGFMNGDTIHAVNGFELTTPDKALEVYTKLKDATDVTFDLSRRGRPLTLTFQITK